MTLGRPRDKAAPKKDGVAGGGATSVRVASPISICVNDELTWSSSGNDKAEVECALKIPKDPFGSNKVSFPGIMHMQTDLLNSTGNIRPGEGQVLKCSSKAAISCWISNRRTSISRNFGTSVNWGGARIAVAHAMAAKDVQSVLSLGEEQGVLVTLNGNTEEEM